MNLEQEKQTEIDIKGQISDALYHLRQALDKEVEALVWDLISRGFDPDRSVVDVVLSQFFENYKAGVKDLIRNRQRSNLK